MIFNIVLYILFWLSFQQSLLIMEIFCSTALDDRELRIVDDMVACGSRNSQYLDMYGYVECLDENRYIMKVIFYSWQKKVSYVYVDYLDSTKTYGVKITRKEFYFLKKLYTSRKNNTLKHS